MAISMTIGRATMMAGLAGVCVLGGLLMQARPSEARQNIPPIREIPFKEPSWPRPTPPVQPRKPGANVSPGEFTIQIEGAKQGKFKGESDQESLKDKQIGLAYVSSLKGASEPGGSGKKAHEPIVITKEWGAASPQIFQAAATNENLKTVAFDFYATSAGNLQVVYTVKLTDAKIASVRQYTENGRFYEDVAFVFEKIEVRHSAGKTSAVDER